MELKIKEALLSNSEELFGMQVEEKLIQFQKTRKDVEGDDSKTVFLWTFFTKPNYRKQSQMIPD